MIESTKTPILVCFFLLALLLIVPKQGRDETGRIASGIVESSIVSGEMQKPDFPHLKSGEQSLPPLSSKSVLVYDFVSEKILLSVNAETPLAVASLTKLVTAVVGTRNLVPQDIITVPDLPFEKIPSPKLGLVAGEQITVASLVEGMLVGSSNDAAEVLAYLVGDGEMQRAVDLMNSFMAGIGSKRSNFKNATGLDEPGAYASARDLLLVAFEIRRNPWLMKTLEEEDGEVRSADGVYIHRFKTPSSLLRQKNYSILGGKTGFTDEARGNLLVFAQNPSGSDIVAILLGSENRDEEMTKILDWVYNTYQWR